VKPTYKKERTLGTVITLENKGKNLHETFSPKFARDMSRTPPGIGCSKTG
jgi:hypothetical protein